MTLVVAGLVALTVGGLLLRRQRKIGDESSEESPESSTTGMEPLLATLELELESLSSWIEEAGDPPLEELARRIGEMDESAYAAVATEAERAGVIATWPVARYAAVFTSYAASERWMRRAWSAAVDGHRSEAIASIESARAHCRNARKALV